jgi:hypothetical protein
MLEPAVASYAEADEVRFDARMRCTISTVALDVGVDDLDVDSALAKDRGDDKTPRAEGHTWPGFRQRRYRGSPHETFSGLKRNGGDKAAHCRQLTSGK